MLKPPKKGWNASNKTQFKNKKKITDKGKLTPSQEADLEYITFKEVIQQSEFYLQMGRGDKIKIGKWLEKLDEIVFDYSWKHKRNVYAKMLYLMVQCSTLVEPFDHFPTEQELPSLSTYKVNMIIEQVEKQINASKCKTRIQNSSNRADSKSHLSTIKRQSAKSIKGRQSEGSVRPFQYYSNVSGQRNIISPFTSKECTWRGDTMRTDRKQRDMLVIENESVDKENRDQVNRKRSIRLPKFYDRRRSELRRRQKQMKTEITPQKLQEYHQFYKNLNKGYLSYEKKQDCSIEQLQKGQKEPQTTEQPQNNDIDEEIVIGTIRTNNYFHSTIQIFYKQTTI